MSMVGFSDGYCTVTYADSLLGVTTKPWASTATSGKEDALQWGRVYIESTYAVPVDIADSSINSALQNANAFLGNEHLTSSLFTAARDAAPQRGLIEKSVKATPVGSTKKYDAQVAKQWVDPYPHITAILQSGGFFIKKGGITAVPLVRR